jgi:SNF2 family DNA or RNA helicase
VRIDPAALRKARRRLDEHRRDHEVVDAITLLRLAAEADTDLAVTESVDGPAHGGWAGDLLSGLPDDALREECEPATFHGTLRPYQRRGLSWLRFLARLGLGGCLADDMGLGKTATTLAHLLERPGPHLVVCPLSVVHNWATEAARFAPSMRVLVHHGSDRTRNADPDQGRLDGTADESPPDLVVTTYGLLVRDLEHLAATNWTTVVLDEAQMVKNPGTNAAKAVRALSAVQKLALTGTPVENRLSELWAILDAVNPGLLGGRERFRHRYAKPIERDGDAAAAAALRRLTQPFVLRRTKADKSLVPDLPDKIEQIAYAGLTREQATLYQQVVDQLLADATNAAGMKRKGLVLAALTRLKQICNHPVHVLGDGTRLSGRSGKLARFDELVDELLDVGERALVFTQFREMCDLLQRHLAERLGLRVPFLHGGVNKARRDAMVASFQAGAGPPLLLISLKAGGTGLNLTAASQVIHYDRWWNPAVEDQATDRAWRIGQGRTVNVHKLVCEGTVEERIAKVIDEKRALADAVVGTGEGWLTELSTDELRDLVVLQHSDGAS